MLLQSVRDSEWEVKEIAEVRTNQEQNITLVTPYFDIVRSKSEGSDEEEEEEKEVQYDHLSPFLPPGLIDQVLSWDQALEVREKALKALKERLIERANIIQVRYIVTSWRYAITDIAKTSCGFFLAAARRTDC